MAKTPDNKCLFAEAYLNQYNSHFTAGCTAEKIETAPQVIQDAYRRFLNPPPYELYDLQDDPHEFTNLAESSSHSVIKARLIAEFQAWQKATSDPFADADNFKSFTRSQLDAINTNYRRDKTFRWPYLNEFRK